MKKICALLCAVGLILLGCPALAAREDFQAYVLPGPYPVTLFPMDESNLAAYCWADDTGDLSLPLYLCWWRDGEIYRQYEYSWDDSRRSDLIPRPDGGYTLIRSGDREGISVFDWGEKGMEKERKLFDRNYAYKITSNGFAVLEDREKEGCFLNLFDAFGALEARVEMPRPMLTIFQGLARSERGEWIVQLYKSGEGEEDAVKKVFYIKDGKIQWEKDVGNHFLSFFFDRDGGFFTTENVGFGQYRPKEIIRYDRDGNMLYHRLLSGNKVTLGCGIHPNGQGGYTLTGVASAFSRGVRRLYRMEVDASFSTLSLDVREFSYDPEDEHSSQYDMFTLPSGASYACLTDGLSPGDAMVLVPFEDLPKADNPGIALK